MNILKLSVITTALIAMYSNAQTTKDNFLTIKLDTWAAKINPKTLEVVGKSNEKEIPIANSQQNDLGEISNFINNNNKEFSWSYPEKEISVEVIKNKNQLIFTFKSKREQTFLWPSTSKSTETQSIVLPDAEGMLIPVSDKYLSDKIKKYYANEYLMNDLSMPLFANINKNSTVTFITNSPLRNTIYLKNENNKIYIDQEHRFEEKDKFAPYQVAISIDETINPIHAAVIFRNYLIENEKFKPLKQKETENPNIKKLYGALHAYAWGDGRTVEALNQLESLGIENMWIGTDVGENDKYQIEKEYILKAKELGYLVGPYDTWENIQNPKTADTPLSIFPDAWPNGAIVLKNGQKLKGFHNRGFEASSEYFALQNPKNKDLKDRVAKFKSTGINSYFLDVDATGSLHDDYSKDHPMDMQKDLDNRIARIKILSDDNKFVTGSESAIYWAVPHIAFAHGNFAVFNGPHWKLTQKKDVYGRWFPNTRPSFFFKSINAPEDYKNTKFNPIYRIPLFQAAFHDSIITTDRWEIPITKFKDCINIRLLLETLYGVPSIWALDIKEIKDYKLTLKKLNDFFSTYHKKIATLPLTNFTWLTNDKLIQQTQFGDDAIVTANFSDKIHENIPAMSVEVKWIKENKSEIFTPNFEKATRL